MGERQGEIFSIDYLIGEPDYLRRGFGKEIIAQMLDRLRKTGAKTVIAEPERDNTASNHALEANGFLWNGEDYYFELQNGPEEMSAFFNTRAEQHDNVNNNEE